MSSRKMGSSSRKMGRRKMGSISQGVGTPRSVIFIVLFCLFLFSPAPLLFPQELHGDPEGGLCLTPKQKAKVEEIRKKYLEELMALREEILRKRLELISEMRKENPDQEEIAKIRREMEDLRIRREILLGKYRDEIDSVLNPDQRRKFENYFGKKRRMRRQIR
jgi:Spy/CpxP family protein refolding chaperone